VIPAFYYYLSVVCLWYSGWV